MVVRYQETVEWKKVRNWRLRKEGISNITKLKIRVEKGSRNERVVKVEIDDTKEIKNLDKNRRERLWK